MILSRGQMEEAVMALQGRTSENSRTYRDWLSSLSFMELCKHFNQLKDDSTYSLGKLLLLSGQLKRQ